MPNVRSRFSLSHAQAVATMVLVTLLWATAGVLARQVRHAQGVEITFWRSVLTAVSMVLILGVWRGAGFWRRTRWSDPLLWLSAACWSVMFTAFMMAMSFTTVANVLIMSALSPVFTALASRLFLGHHLPARTWVAIAAAAAGILYMYASKLSLSHSREMLGIGIALLVPLAGSFQWVLMHREKQRLQALRKQAQAWAAAHQEADAPPPPAVVSRDMLPALILGAALSALMCLPFVFPLQASWADMGWLALLGMFQLAIPCSLIVVCSRVLHAPEISLLALLETIFGILFAWWGAGEVPGVNVLVGGGLIIGARALNEWLGWKQTA